MASATTRDDPSDPAFLGTEAHPINGVSAANAEDSKSTPTPTPAPQTLTWPLTSTSKSDSESAQPTPTIQVSLTHDKLSLQTASDFISSPSAGANVFFTGTTRNTFSSRTVTRLEYSAYPALALRTMLNLCQAVHKKHALEKVYLIHRLGVVNVSEASIVIGVSSAHRKAAWDAGEELLEQVKDKVEVWKREWFLDGGVVQGKDGQQGTTITTSDATERGEWRANADKDNRGNPVLR